MESYSEMKDADDSMPARRLEKLPQKTSRSQRSEQPITYPLMKQSVIPHTHLKTASSRFRTFLSA